MAEVNEHQASNDVIRQTNLIQLFGKTIGSIHFLHRSCLFYCLIALSLFFAEKMASSQKLTIREIDF